MSSVNIRGGTGGGGGRREEGGRGQRKVKEKRNETKIFSQKLCLSESVSVRTGVTPVNGVQSQVTGGEITVLTQWGQLHLPSGAFSMSGSRQTM